MSQTRPSTSKEILKCIKQTQTPMSKQENLKIDLRRAVHSNSFIEKQIEGFEKQLSDNKIDMENIREQVSNLEEVIELLFQNHTNETDPDDEKLIAWSESSSAPLIAKNGVQDIMTFNEELEYMIENENRIIANLDQLNASTSPFTQIIVDQLFYEGTITDKKQGTTQRPRSSHSTLWTSPSSNESAAPVSETVASKKQMP